MIEKPYKFGFRYPRQKILQGELVYVAHPTENYCGWYQKLRKSSKIVGYFQIQGNEIGKFFRASTIEDSECWNAQARMRVTGGENVCAFIASNFSDSALVYDIENGIVLNQIKEYEARIAELKLQLAD